MNPTDIVRRLRAFEQGRALPTAATLPWPRVVPRDALVLAFVRMGGEHLPWGFAVGHPGEKPAIMTVPEPRNLGAAADLMLALAPALLEHVGHPSTLHGGLAQPDGEPAPAPALAPRQLWLAGATHLEMLHLLDFRYTRTRTGDAERVATLRALGRACGWLFREANRPGQVRVMDATRRLREVFAFPADDARQQHLGLLLALLDARGSRAERFAAAERAEELAVGVTLAPELERNSLEAAVDRYREGTADQRARAASEIDAVLRAELLRRWELTAEAFALLADDPRDVNPYVGALVEAGHKEYAGQYWRVEVQVDSKHEPFVPDAETDGMSASAAARYFVHLESDETARSELVHGDRALLRAAIDAGDAIEGTIRKACNLGTGRAKLPHWTLEVPANVPLSLREGSGVCVAGMPRRTATIVSIQSQGDRRTILVEITNWKTARKAEGIPAADDAGALEGARVTLVAAGMRGLSERKAFAAWTREGPGAWLTHGASRPVSDPTRPARPELVDLVERLYGAAP